ncbi:Fructose-1,6-bisphosphatase,related [Neospora caninum Liverpool]|uniref:Fructose-1,6-bisphosphatase,related n=1 Tax=Neospora caninum (strain Liverpool) TaxID=572307 RepID=F0VKH8_NEOCL|nr:Fructose-1,6-bisphosphatase,related [Neospora caninum Liverpool]CBZ54579.1 Fructose-1,6-bisphosphatase,related [Neospora caninum Liverpool]|eukprot:XP_003884609.1 Fructose-1,6-bisphosphatase,related [Neospora caninum Liverpool]
MVLSLAFSALCHPGVSAAALPPSGIPKSPRRSPACSDFLLGVRFSGGLVPDVYQIFVKQQGVFCNPASKAAPAKLRMCFEVLPIALLVEAAGGRTSNGKTSLLDVGIEHMDHRSALCCGSADEIQRMEETFAAIAN